MKGRLFRNAALLAVIAMLGYAATSQASLIEVGSGGTTAPAGVSGSTVTSTVSVTLSQSAFTTAGLWDGASSTVGGGSVSGSLWYAFNATPLQIQGDTNLPSTKATGTHSPSPGYYAGGETLKSSSLITCFGENSGAYAESYITSSGGSDLNNGTRYDLSPNRTTTWLINIVFNANGNDTLNMYAYLYDNGSSTATVTLAKSISGDFSFDAFQFISAVSNTSGNSWTFSNVAFATTQADALAGLTSVPEPTSMALLVSGALAILAYAWKKRRG